MWHLEFIFRSLANVNKECCCQCSFIYKLTFLNICFNSFEYIPSGIPESYGNLCFAFLRNYQAVFKAAAPFIFTRVLRVPVSL